jgi:hypothetical protein
MPSQYDSQLMADLKTQYGSQWYRHYDKAYRERHMVSYKDITQGKQAAVEVPKEPTDWLNGGWDAVNG